MGRRCGVGKAPRPSRPARHSLDLRRARLVEQGKRRRPVAKGCPSGATYFDRGESLFSLEKKTPPDGISGIAVELTSDGTIYATIPILRDRLDLAQASVVNGLSLSEITSP